jgi:hypothetical protein
MSEPIGPPYRRQADESNQEGYATRPADVTEGAGGLRDEPPAACARCGHLCPECARASLPDGYAVVSLDRDQPAEPFHDDPQRDRRLAQKVLDELEPPAVRRVRRTDRP